MSSSTNQPAKSPLHAGAAALALVLLLTGCEFSRNEQGGYTGHLNFSDPTPKVNAFTSPRYRPADVRVVAIVNPPGPNSTPEDEIHDRQIQQVFLQELLRKGYRVVEKSISGELLKEIKWQSSGVTAEDAGKLGRILNASHVLTMETRLEGHGVRDRNTGAVYNCTVQMICRLIEVEQHEVCFSASSGRDFTVYSRVDMMPKVLDVAGALAATIPPKQ